MVQGNPDRLIDVLNLPSLRPVAYQPTGLDPPCGHKLIAGRSEFGRHHSIILMPRHETQPSFRSRGQPAAPRTGIPVGCDDNRDDRIQLCWPLPVNGRGGVGQIRVIWGRVFAGRRDSQLRRDGQDEGQRVSLRPRALRWRRRAGRPSGSGGVEQLAQQVFGVPLAADTSVVPPAA